MSKLIQTLVILLLSFWLWGVDWSQRNIDPETTKFLISSQYALAVSYFYGSCFEQNYFKCKELLELIISKG